MTAPNAMPDVKSSCEKPYKELFVERYQPADYKTVVIYHGGCPDGLASAFAFLNVYRAKRTNIPIVPKSTYFYPCFERALAKDASMPDLNNKDVYIVDYSYSPDELITIRNIANTVTIFDHHETAQKDLAKPIPGVRMVFDMNRCGAEITWDEIYGKATRPWFMVHIRDRDLWTWDKPDETPHPDSKSFCAAFFELGMTFETLTAFTKYTNIQIQELYTRGKVICDIEEKIHIRVAKHAEKVIFEGHLVYAINLPTWQSEVGNILANYPDAAFAMIYRWDPKNAMWYISLRGSNHSPNVGAIAKACSLKYKTKGGGHAKAAGFEYPGLITDLICNHR
jgi:oligoribonuclease NrnB/cAMP/cGMP phosphodiesterase (DHH superfamily)